MSAAFATNVWPTGARRRTESWPDVKVRKFVRMLKYLLRRRHNCPAEGTLI